MDLDGLRRELSSFYSAPKKVTSRVIDEYLAVLDDAAFGAATQVIPKFISPPDPAARWTGAHGGQTFFAYSTNYLIDVEHASLSMLSRPQRSGRQKFLPPSA